MVLLFFSILYLVPLISTQQTQPQPDWLLQTRQPPRAQSQDVINKVLDKILSGDDQNLFAGFTNGPEEPGPLALINSSKFWNWQFKPIGSVKSEEAVRQFLQEYEQEATKVYSTSVEAGWNYFTNLTEYNRRRLVESDALLSLFLKLTARRAKEYSLDNLQNPQLKRLLKKLAIEGPNALPEEQFRKLTMIQSEMGQIFANAAVCEQGQQPPCILRLEPDLTNIMATSKDYRQLYYVWLSWRNAVGPTLRSQYLEMVRLNNEAAKLNGFQDASQLWKDAYETADFEDQLEKAFEELKPFYHQLHAYVRRKLRAQYPQFVSKDGALPAHLLGSMWANTWVNLYETTVPFVGQWSTDPTPALFFQNYTVEKMFRKAEDFFVSLGFAKLPSRFWRDSMFTRPRDRDALCLPTSVDFRNGQDFRVKMCAQISADDFIRAHHELGQVYYFISYKNQSIPFRDGANPAAIDAVGSVMATVARAPEYLHGIGLLPFGENNTEADINFLYRNALDRIASLPFNLAVDKWRWRVFNGEYNNTNMNKEYWNLRLKYQGIVPPVERTERDFDAGSNFQIAQNMPTINYFVGYVLQFQLLKAMCDAAGHTGPLIKCNFYQSTRAGAKLRTFLEAGASKPWPEILQTLTGSSRLDVKPMLEYFQPLYNWLRHDNEKNKEYLGWNVTSITKVAITPLGGASNTNGIIVSNEVGQPKGGLGNGLDQASTWAVPGGVAFTGEPCSDSNYCVQNSYCNGTICIACPEGTTAMTNQCHPKNDADGFGFGGGFNLNIVKHENSAARQGNATAAGGKLPTDHHMHGGSRKESAIFGLIILSLLAIFV